MDNEFRFWSNWGSPKILFNNDRALKAEQITPEILKKEGFDDWLWVSENAKNFPFDFIARKANEIYIIEVTTSWCKTSRRYKTLSRLIKWLNAKYGVLFINLTWERYYLKFTRREFRVPSSMVLSPDELDNMKKY